MGIRIRARQITAFNGLAILGLALLSLGLMAIDAQAQQNPFGIGKPADNSTVADPASSAAKPAEAPAEAAPPPGNPFGQRGAGAQAATPTAPMIVLPAPLRALFRQIADWQRDLNRFLSARLRESGKDGGAIAALSVLFVSFLYGVLHAAGPGHGKMVVASYFTARRAPLRTGILMGSVIALTQAVVAILMVWIMAIVLGGNQLQIIERTNLLELASYAVICGIGLYMTYTALRGQDSCGHDHGPAASTFDDAHDHHDHHTHGHHTHAHDHHDHGHGGHGHQSHTHQSHNHGHHDHDAHASNPRESWVARKARAVLGRDGEVIVVGIVSGVRPCTGSILVLLFAVANGVFLLGVAAAFSIAVGVAITISALGIGAIVLRRSLAGKEAATSPGRLMAQRAVSIAGSLAVVLMGALLFGGTLSGTGLI